MAGHGPPPAGVERSNSMRHPRLVRIRVLLTAAALAAITTLNTVASVLADSGGGTFPR